MSYLLICYFFNTEKCAQAAKDGSFSNLFIVVGIISILAILIKLWSKQDEKQEKSTWSLRRSRRQK
jgi:hypothetical protein